MILLHHVGERTGQSTILLMTVSTWTLFDMEFTGYKGMNLSYIFYLLFIVVFYIHNRILYT